MYKKEVRHFIIFEKKIVCFNCRDILGYKTIHVRTDVCSASNHKFYKKSQSLNIHLTFAVPSKVKLIFLDFRYCTIVKGLDLKSFYENGTQVRKGSEHSFVIRGSNISWPVLQLTVITYRDL